MVFSEKESIPFYSSRSAVELPQTGRAGRLASNCATLSYKSRSEDSVNRSVAGQLSGT